MYTAGGARTEHASVTGAHTKDTGETQARIQNIEALHRHAYRKCQSSKHAYMYTGYPKLYR